MEPKWWLFMVLLLLGTVVQAHDGHADEDDDDEEDNDVIDVEEDLEDGIEEIEDSKPGDGATLPPSPKVIYKALVPTGEVYFVGAFDKGMLVGWVLSKVKKDDTDDEIAKYLKWESICKWEVEEMKESKLPGDKGLDYKLHFIFRHKNPKTDIDEEKYAKRPDMDLKTYFTDKKTHLYTLVLNPDNSFEILVDQMVVNSGNLLNDMTPPVNPSREIENPNDQKPEDWDERLKIPDPDAVKLDDWDDTASAKIPDKDATKPEGWLDDEPEYVSDPDAEKPEDWDEDMNGEWEAPQIANPKSPMIDNPNCQGIWKPRKIPNPDFFEDLEPFKMTPFSAVGLELWSMTSDIFFDNFIICKAADGAAEPDEMGQMLEAAEECPWLWVVYILIVALPLFLVVLFCCSGKKQPCAAEYKKTDAPQPDVKEEEEKEEKKEEKEKKDDEEEETEEKLEEKQKSDAEEDAGTVSQEDEDRKPKAEEDEVLNRSPRNRKPRRD
uniref:Calnexin n=1 Tax=Monodelphis domestica TaxID=13616 RepID=A0A5F8H419_MONDO